MARQKQGKWSRRSLSHWRLLLSKFDGSGMGVEAFCRRETISAASFYRWRKLLATDDDAGGGVGSETAPAFVNLGTLSPGSLPRARIDLRLDLGDGLIVHLVRN